MGFHKVAKYYYTGWHEPASEMQFLVNKKAFDKLPKKYQVMLEVGMKAAAMDMYIENFAESVDAWAKMKKEYPDIKVKTFPLPVLKALKKAADEVYAKYSAENPKFKEIHDDYFAYMMKARDWSMMSQYYYLQTSKELGITK